MEWKKKVRNKSGWVQTGGGTVDNAKDSRKTQISTGGKRRKIMASLD